MAHRYRFKPLYLVVLQALAVHAMAQEAADDNKQTSTFGLGQTRQVQNITHYDLSKALPGTNPLKTLEKLPGVLFESTDPWGAYEWSARFSIRGFSEGQMGFTLDGVPLGDMNYSNNDGLHITRAISPENLSRVVVSQGAGAVGTASTSNLGGTVQFFSSDPMKKFGVTANQTIGSSKTYRTFARVDTGQFASGTRAYISLTHQRSDKWKGWGPQEQDQINTKLVHDFSGDTKVTAFWNYSNRLETDYQDLSPVTGVASVQRLGWDWDNYAPDWQRSVNAAKGIFTGPDNDPDDAYYLGRGLRKDNLSGATLDTKLGSALTLKTTLYHHGNNGQGHWYTPYASTSPTIPIAIRTSEYEINRNGVLADLSWDLDTHTIDGGFWTEHNHHHFARRFYPVVLGADGNAVYTGHFLTDPMSTAFEQDFEVKTTQFYLQDTMSMLDDKLSINAGFKSPKVDIDATSANSKRAAGSITAKKSFLPQIGARYDFSKNDEVFASLSKNMRAFNAGVNGPFWTNQVGFDQTSGNLKPETSTSVDVGYRFTRGPISGSVAAYTVDFNDRTLLLQACPNIVGCAATLVNVGQVKTRGMEAAAVWTLSPHWLWFNSYTYNDSKYESDYVDGNGNVTHVSGKQVVNSPKTMFNSEITYDNGTWYARAHAKYTGSRYYTYTNDDDVPAYWVVNLSGGWHTKSLGMLKDASIQLNVQNVLNKQYYSSLGTNGFFASDASAFPYANTVQQGSPRQFFVTFSAKL